MTSKTNSTSRTRSRRTASGRSTPEIESAARSKRARDHLARKRARDRERLERDRRRHASRGSRLRIARVAAPIAFALAIFLGARYATPIMNVLLLSDVDLHTIAVQGSERLSPALVAAQTGALVGDRLATIDPEQVKQNLVEEPWIASSRVLRLPNGTMVVSVIERTAVARWQAQEDAPIELIDRTGLAFSGDVDMSGDVPLVRGAADARGELPPEAFDLLLELERYASLETSRAALTLHLPPPALATDDDSEAGFVLEFSDRGARALLGKRLLPQRIARLAALLEDESLALAEMLIDLRYADRAVLRTVPTSG